MAADHTFSVPVLTNQNFSAFGTVVTGQVVLTDGGIGVYVNQDLGSGTGGGPPPRPTSGFLYPRGDY
jgi:hypothetical protein